MRTKQLVIFGITSSLVSDKIISALNKLHLYGYINNCCKIIGIGRQDLSVESLINNYFQNKNYDLFKKLSYHQISDFSNVEFYNELNILLTNNNADPLIYLSLPPSVSEDVVSAISKSSLSKYKNTTIIIDKPFGYCLESANRMLTMMRSKDFLCDFLLLDHYLAKPAFIELDNLNNYNPIINEALITQAQSVHILLTESIGIGSRAKFFDQTGHIKDVVQSHMIQMLCLIAMSKNKIQAQNHRRLAIAKNIEIQPNNMCTGQYTNNNNMPSYVNEQNVPSNSTTETFAYFRAHVKNEQWSGVPFYFFTGKRLKSKISQITVMLKNNGHISIQQDPSPSIVIQNVKGIDNQTMSINKPLSDYEYIFNNIINGRSDLCALPEEAIASWIAIEPLLNFALSSAPLKYPCGSWGPNNLIDKDTECITHSA